MNTFNVGIFTLITISGALLDSASVLSEETVSTTPVPHRHRHENYRTRLRSTEMPLSIPPLPVPKAIGQVIPNQAIDSSVYAPKRSRRPAHPPSYLTIIYDNLMASSKTGFGIEKASDDPVIRAVRPKKISHGILGTTVITFKLNRNRIGVFNSAQIIFTLKDELQGLQDGSRITVNARFRNQQEKKTKLLWKNTKYYEFDLSRFLKSSLSSSEEFGDQSESILFRLEVIVFKNSRTQVPMAEIFDLHQNKPFLFLQYTDNIPPLEEDMVSSSSEENYAISDNELSRRRRSLIFSLGEILQIETEGKSSATSNETLTVESVSTTTPDYFTSRRARRNRTVGRSRSRRRHSQNNSGKVTSDSPKSRSTSTCRRYEWLVKPADVGLTDVIRPALLELGYCAGSCPFPLQNDVFNFTLHSFFVDRHRIQNGFDVPPNFPNSNCVPVSYKEIMVLEAEGSGYVVYIHQDGSVGSCGCR